MASTLKRNKLAVAGVLAGAIMGWLYWKYIGCMNGGCAITSRPQNTVAYFAILFGLVFSILETSIGLYKEDKKTK